MPVANIPVFGTMSVDEDTGQAIYYSGDDADGARGAWLPVPTYNTYGNYADWLAGAIDYTGLSRAFESADRGPDLTWNAGLPPEFQLPSGFAPYKHPASSTPWTPFEGFSGPDGQYQIAELVAGEGFTPEQWAAQGVRAVMTPTGQMLLNVQDLAARSQRNQSGFENFMTGTAPILAGVAMATLGLGGYLPGVDAVTGLPVSNTSLLGSLTGSGTAPTTGVDFANATNFNPLDPSSYFGGPGTAEIGGALTPPPATIDVPGLTSTGALDFSNPGFNIFDPSTWYGGVENAVGAAANAATGTGTPTTPPAGTPPAGTPPAGTPPAGSGSGNNEIIPGIPNNVLTGIGQGLLGFLGAEQQANALSDTADKYLALGAPFRGMLAASYQPGFSIWDDAATRDAAARAADIAARSYSATAGNPFDSPTAQAGIYEQVLRGVALPQLNTYRSQLGGFGQLGINTAGTADLSGAANAGAGLDAIGFGLGTALSNPQQDIERLLRSIGGRGNYTINLGNSLV